LVADFDVFLTDFSADVAATQTAGGQGNSAGSHGCLLSL